MPVFTLRLERHTNYKMFGECYSMDIVSPDLTCANVFIRAFTSDQFGKSKIGRDVAKELDLDFHGKEAIGSVTLQTYFEGGPVVHRTIPFPVVFEWSDHPGFQRSIHIAYHDLETFLTLRTIENAPTEPPFLTLDPIAEVRDIFCIILPIERCNN